MSDEFKDIPLNQLSDKRTRNPRGNLMDNVIYRKVDIQMIDIDLQHPSLASEEAMERHIRCVDNIRSTLNVLPQILMPVILSERDDAEGRYWLIDGWGRIEVARERLKATDIDAMVLPPLAQEERVIIRLQVNTRRAA